ncbi:uncharacterized protein [Drosophila pseudoobscura]|uniref:MD-2-related lipid-recognition domain-containing protein n=1 Tax=Drosophila pseudoobscura pseudoobscura TaxID=46245 RepID=A0A6I8VQS7_DROPS|nr:uncharacterized protein LOC6898293 [Drosophila pseudoobscura]
MAMQSRLIFIVLYGIFFASTLDYTDAVVFKLTNFVCESYNKSWVVFNYCRLKALFKRANGYRPWLYEIKIDMCQYFRKPFNPLVAIVYGLFKEYTNINHTCPYVGPQIVKGFYLRHELLRLPLPTGDYLVMIRWYYDKRLQFDTNVSFVFEEDLINRD